MGIHRCPDCRCDRPLSRSEVAARAAEARWQSKAATGEIKPAKPRKSKKPLGHAATSAPEKNSKRAGDSHWLGPDLPAPPQKSLPATAPAQPKADPRKEAQMQKFIKEHAK